MRFSFLRSLTVLFSLVLLAPALLAGTARAEPLTVILDWFLNPDHGPLVVAQEKGYFAEAGLEVELLVATIEPLEGNGAWARRSGEGQLGSQRQHEEQHAPD